MRQRIRFGFVSVVSLTCLLAHPTFALAQVGYTGLVAVVRDRSDVSGATDAVYVFNSVDVTRGRFRISGTVPFIRQRFEPVAAALDGVSYSGWSTGVGDPIVRTDVALIRRGAGGLTLSMSGALKIPVAGTDLGSGEFDGALGMTLAASRGGRSLLADVTYWILGDPPDVTIRNVPAVYIGYATIVGRSYRWSTIVGLSSAVSILPGLAAPTQAQVGVLRALGTSAAVGATLSLGLNEAAPDLAAGATWRVTF